MKELRRGSTSRPSSRREVTADRAIDKFLNGIKVRFNTEMARLNLRRRLHESARESRRILIGMMSSHIEEYFEQCLNVLKQKNLWPVTRMALHILMEEMEDM